MTVRFGASTFSFIRRGPALDALRTLRAIGYERFDILGVPGHLWPSELDGRARASLRDAFAADDIALESISPQPVDLNLSSPLADVRTFSVGVYADVIRLAVDLGARAVVVVPGRVAAVPPARADTVGRAAQSIAELVDIARAEGLSSLLIENHPTSGLPYAEDAGELIQAVGASEVGVAYDVANAEFVGEDQLAAVRLLGSLIGQTHLSDARPGAWAHDPIGTGSVRFAAFLAELDAHGLTPTHIVEIIADEATEAYTAAAAALSLPLARPMADPLPSPTPN
jgi:L-ribulose-5-phosphate 3-epimerase